MNKKTNQRRTILSKVLIFGAAFIFLFFNLHASAFTLNVQDKTGNPVNGFRWLVEIDTTNHTIPGNIVANSISLDIHNSYNPVVIKGHSDTNTANIIVPSNVRYYVSVLPDADYAMSGGPVDINQTSLTVIAHPYPIPTAQISVFVFADQNPINNVFDEHEQGIGGATVVISDIGGQLMQDTFGNMLGTTYQQNPDGSFVIDANTGAPVVAEMGTGIIRTLTKHDFDTGNNPFNLKIGEALVKYIAPGKYGVIVIPPGIDDQGNGVSWIQTSTIEGTPTIDAWVKANEPKLFVEGFGTGFNHVFYGFIKTGPVTDSNVLGQIYPVPPWNKQTPSGSGIIEGTLRLNHFSRPPMTQGFFAGDIISEGWIGLNDPLVRPGVAIEAGGPLQYAGIYVAQCDPNGHFVITNVPAGTYQLVTWDTPLDNLFGFHNVTVGSGEHVNLGDILEYRWFGTLEGSVFLDNGAGDPNKAGNGFRDPNEIGISNQNLNIRFRDGTIYQSTISDMSGDYAFEEVFPFFKWLVVEVDFTRFKDTGMTTVVDAGGQVLPDDGWNMPSRNKLNPQVQIDMDPNSPTFGQEIINPNTGNALSRTQVSTSPGEVLLQAMHLFLNQTNVIDWGKITYEPGQNGGISGVVFYDTTRAENDPRYCTGETWCPGVPRVQVNLYLDNEGDGVIDDLDANGGPTLADVDNYPFGWRDGTAPRGSEDIDRNGNNIFNGGDAIQIVTTDSWDDNKPTGSIGPILNIHGQQVFPGFDAFGTWNQVRPGVFDGGYAINSYFPGGIDSGSAEVDGLPTSEYIVEAVPPPGYEIVKEEDKNVDFGDTYIPSPLLLPPILVGDLREVPDELSLFPGVECAFAGQMRPTPDRKQIIVYPCKNAACDFFLFTEVPKAARGVGFVNNDLGAEFNQGTPNFGEKIAPSWIPISVRDWSGTELSRIYCDEFGCYNFLIPSTSTINVPSPSGVSPQMITIILNDPIKTDGTIDPFYNPMYSITPWTFQYYPGSTSYLDTPLVPLAAFAPADVKIDTEPDVTPVIYSVDGPGVGFGPVITQGTAGVITIRSKGTASIINPAYDPNIPGSQFRITRNYGFGPTQGQVTLDGNSLTINSWTDAEIQAVVPATAVTGQIMVVRGDNGIETEVGVTLHIINPATTIVRYVPADFNTIQDAIDAAGHGDLIVVAPGTYNENIIMNKPLRLQGAGPGGVTIFGYPNPLEKLDFWHDRLNALGAREFSVFLMKDPFSENEAPGIIVAGQTAYQGGNLQNPDPTITNFFNQGHPFDQPGRTLIDGFTISGSKAGGAIFAISSASNLVISNINATGNQGSYAGGISIGTQDVGFDSNNNDVVIRYCKVHKNGGTQGPGGICMDEYASNYLVERNIVWGNFSRFNGGGIGHRGYCPGNNIIRFNKIIFNEDHFGALLAAAGDGGGIYIGGDVAGGTGTGNVTINSNLIQGNMTGSGYGGGIRAFAVNAEDVMLSPDDSNNWFTLNIFNNIIVNNVAGLAGAGISLQDTAKVNIIHNTIVNNDCTATAQLAFTAGQLNSTPQPAGVVGAKHSDLLVALFGAGLQQTYSNPVLTNNIIWHNRSWYNDASLNGNQGGLVPRAGSPYWDLAILGSTTSSDPHLSPENCILTSRIDSATGFNYGTSNNYNNPLHVAAYENQLQSAAVLDEGGNFINVLIKPLTIEGSDYHINNNSPAVGLGNGAYINQFTELQEDYDSDTRSDTSPDSGADETAATFIFAITSVTADPNVILDTQTSQLLVTTNLDGTPGITYQWLVPAGQGSVNNAAIANPIYTPPDVLGTQTFTITVNATYNLITVSSSVNITVIDANVSSSNFNNTIDGFVYYDDTFRGTHQPLYARGNWVGGGITGRALRVRLGGRNNAEILGMSGGWQKTFNLPASGNVLISFMYELRQSPNYENDEFSQVMVSIDGIPMMSGSNDYIAQINGNGNGHGFITTGWQLFEGTITLAAGVHTITIGGYNNKKNSGSEFTTILFDNVSIIMQNIDQSGNTPPVITSISAVPNTILDNRTAQLNVNAADDGIPAGLTYQWIIPALAGTVSNSTIPNPLYTPPDTIGNQTYTLSVRVSDGQYAIIGTTNITVVDGLILSASFNSNTDGFSYQDDTFRGTTAFSFSSGSRVNGGVTGRALSVLLGGRNQTDVIGMSGGWIRTFNLAVNGNAKITFMYNLSQSPNYENDEFSDMLLSVDGVLIGTGANDYISRITGNGNGGGDITTGWQTFDVTLPMTAGNHTITIGGYNNKKTDSNEETTILIDDVSIIEN